MSGSHNELDGGQRSRAGRIRPPDRYGMVFALLLASFLATAVLSNRQARIVTLLLYAAALGLALRFTRLPTRTARQLRWGLLAGSALVAALVVVPGRVVEGLAACGPTPFFADGEPTDSTAIQYFAFITLTTTGYGDLTPAGQPGRSLAVLDALSGQIFLVSLVARLVTVLGTERRPPRDETTPDD